MVMWNSHDWNIWESRMFWWWDKAAIWVEGDRRMLALRASLAPDCRCGMANAISILTPSYPTLMLELRSRDLSEYGMFAPDIYYYQRTPLRGSPFWYEWYFVYCFSSNTRFWSCAQIRLSGWSFLSYVNPTSVLGSESIFNLHISF